MDEFKSLSENNIISTLLKKVAILERENTDIRALYATMNEELFKKLEDFESYKKRVKNMEDKYVERIQKLQYKVNVMEQLRTNEAKESKDGMSRVYLKRIQELERLQEKNMEDLVQKCDQLLKLEIEHDEQSGQLNNALHQVQQKENTNKVLREQIAKLEGEKLNNSTLRSINHLPPQQLLPSSPPKMDPEQQQLSPPGTPMREPLSPHNQNVASLMGIGGKRTPGPPIPSPSSAQPVGTADKQKIIALERLLKEKSEHVKALERKNQALSKSVQTLKQQLDIETNS